MNKNNLFKLNGEYVKFFTTSNKILPNIYKNSGAIIIYSELDKNNSSNNRNYIYLGGEMIASGYGSNSSDTRDKLENISVNYDNDINNINKSLTYLNKSINDTFSYFENNVILKNDNISSTYITLNNKNISLLDFLTNTVNAQYNELEIVSQVNKIEYKTCENTNKVNVINFLPDEKIYLPIGSLVISISTTIKINYNDCGGLQQVNASFYKTTNNIKNNKLTTEIINNVDGNNIPIYPKSYTLKDNENISSKEITLSYVYKNENRYFINYGENILIDDIYVDSYQTTTFKPYKTKDLINDDTNIYNGIYSIENILEPKHYLIKNVKVYGSLYSSYVNVNEFNKDYTTNMFIKNLDKSIILDNNIVELPINKNMNTFIFAIPNIYNINKAIFINNKYTENWTGNINVSKLNIENKNYLNLYQNFNTTYNINLNMKFNLYYIVFDENIIDNNIGYNGILKLYLYNTKNSLEYNINKNNNENIINDDYYYPLYDEEFSNLYWGDNDFKTTLNFNDKYYITTNDDFLINPLSYESNFIGFNSIFDIIYNDIIIENPGKFYFMIPLYYKNSLTLKINENVVNLDKYKLIKYNNNDYIILYNDNINVPKDSEILFDPIIKIYFGNDIKNITEYNKNFDNFDNLNINNIELYNIKIDQYNKQKYLGYFFILIPSELDINIYIINNENSIKINYNVLGTLTMYDLTYKILTNTDYIDDIEYNSNIIINKNIDIPK